LAPTPGTARLLNDPQGFNGARTREIDCRVIGLF
jgi:hypothetical protein